MSRREKITYPTKQATSTVSDKYHVGSIVFIPFVINCEASDGRWEVVWLHEDVDVNVDRNGLHIPKEILP